MASSGLGQASDPLQAEHGSPASGNVVEMQHLEHATVSGSQMASAVAEPSGAGSALITTPFSTETSVPANEASLLNASGTAAESAPTSTTSASPSGMGPSLGTTRSPLSSNQASGPVCLITLQLTSGPRHPFKLDEKYLMKRNVNVPAMTENGKKDPFSISVYTLKELILREWRDEWEAKPSSPSSIRLIHFGRLLDDKLPLRECRFTSENANVVHMTIKPQDMVDDEEASKGKALGRERDSREGTARCRCVIL